MGFKDLKEQFAKIDATDLANDTHDGPELQTYRYWKLRLLFEINGNLDSLAVAMRTMATAQTEVLANGQQSSGKFLAVQTEMMKALHMIENHYRVVSEIAAKKAGL